MASGFAAAGYVWPTLGQAAAAQCYLTGFLISPWPDCTKIYISGVNGTYVEISGPDGLVFAWSSASTTGTAGVWPFVPATGPNAGKSISSPVLSAQQISAVGIQSLLSGVTVSSVDPAVVAGVFGSFFTTVCFFYFFGRAVGVVLDALRGKVRG